jgi:hypothetical protein
MLSRMGRQVDLQNAAAVAALFEDAAGAMRESPWRRGSIIELSPPGRLLVTGDLHDNPLHLQKILRLAQLDESPDRHVVLHEMIHSERLVNGVDLSHRILAKVALALIVHPRQVHPLLANHELAQLTGKGVSKGAGDSVLLFNDGLQFVFGEEWESVAQSIHGFIRAMPIALRSGPARGVFCAHSLPAARMMKNFDLDVIARELRDDDYESKTGSAYLMVWGRGHTPEQLDQIAAKWNVKLFCLGHQHAETGIELAASNCLVINSDHERATVVPIDLAHVPTAEEALISAIPLSAI